jgi:hypothetical protein
VLIWTYGISILKLLGFKMGRIIQDSYKGKMQENVAYNK